jgi:DNA replication and repair protein RecF
MVEAEYVQSGRGRPPLLLLDDIFAELDPGRAGRILEMLDARHAGQVLLTAPKDTDVDLRQASGSVSSLARWRIDTGVIHA